jgi:hypothetical protein
MQMATHGTIVCAFHGAGATATALDVLRVVSHSGHTRAPRLTVAPQDEHLETRGVPQRPQNFPSADWPQLGHWIGLALTFAPYHEAMLGCEALTRSFVPAHGGALFSHNFNPANQSVPRKSRPSLPSIWIR